MNKKDKLLAVLDMTEVQQAVWLAKEGYISCPLTVKEFGSKTDDWRWEIWGKKNIKNIKIQLADLAFRMRDEAVKELMCWDAAKIEVWQYWCKKESREIQLELFWIDWSRPIHWIIAALIAQEQTK